MSLKQKIKDHINQQGYITYQALVDICNNPDKRYKVDTGSRVMRKLTEEEYVTPEFNGNYIERWSKKQKTWTQMRDDLKEEEKKKFLST